MLKRAIAAIAYELIACALRPPSVACSLARELLSQACQRRRRLELSRACAAVQGGTRREEKRANGAATTRMPKPAKGNHELAACKDTRNTPARASRFNRSKHD